MIKVQNLVKEFGVRRAVDDVSFEVAKGTVLGFLGPNGAGKTTTIRMIAGYLPPTTGAIEVNGVNVVAQAVVAQRQIGYMPENTPLYGDMTVEEFLKFVAEVRGYAGAEKARRVDQALEKCMLRHVRRQSIETLSKGYRQRTCLAQALLHDPGILLLDEPTEGLDPNQKQVVRDMIRAMSAEKIIMLSTHVLEEVEALCTRIMIISGGRIKADSTPADLRKQSDAYNQLTLAVVAPREEVLAAFRGLGDVARVDLLESAGDRQTLLLQPRNRQPLAVSALELAQKRKWLVTDARTDQGRLDDVFRRITTTEDTNLKNEKEAA